MLDVAMLDVGMLFLEDYLLYVDCDLPSISLGLGYKVRAMEQVPTSTLVCLNLEVWMVYIRLAM